MGCSVAHWLHPNSREPHLRQGPACKCPSRYSGSLDSTSHPELPLPPGVVLYRLLPLLPSTLPISSEAITSDPRSSGDLLRLVLYILRFEEQGLAHEQVAL
jgi:hypothetical protein